MDTVFIKNHVLFTTMDMPNIKALVKLLETLGFSSLLDKKLVYHACFRQKYFSIKEQKAFGEDLMSYEIFFKENEADRKLFCSHYDAALRKAIRIEPAVLNEIDLRQLDDRMKRVNWEQIAQFGTSSEFNLADKETWKEQAWIEQISGDLETLSSTEEGRNVAGCLQYKHWADLPLESMITNLFFIKTKLEYSQRFYIINEEGITAGEAYRFLNNRWIQRQMQEKKKTDFLTRGGGHPTGTSAKDGKPKKRNVKTK